MTMRENSKKILYYIGEKIESLQAVSLKLVNQKSTESHLKPNKKWSLALGWTLVGTLTAGVISLFIAETDEVVNVQGILTPSANTVDVQVPEGGIVERIYVKESDMVKKGEKLIKLDNRVDKNLGNKYDSMVRKLSIQRDLLLNSQSLIEKTHATKIKNKKIEREYNEGLLKTLEDLYNMGASSKVQVLQQENRLNNIVGDIEVQELGYLDNLNTSKQKIAEVEGRIEELIEDKKNQKIALEYSIIKAPISGYVFDLKPKTKNYVANKSTKIMQIVGDGELIFSLKIPAKDIGLLKKGQKVEVSIDSYPANEFGTIEGKLKSLGTDAIAMNPNNDTGYYIPATIKLKKQTLTARGVTLDIRPGMSGSANIKLRKVKYIELILGGFRDKSRSLRSVGGRG